METSVEAHPAWNGHAVVAARLDGGHATLTTRCGLLVAPPDSEDMILEAVTCPLCLAGDLN